MSVSLHASAGNKDEKKSGATAGIDVGLLKPQGNDKVNEEYQIYHWVNIILGFVAVLNGVFWLTSYITLDSILLAVLCAGEAFICYRAFKAKNEASHDQQAQVTKWWWYYLIAVVVYYGWFLIRGIWALGLGYIGTVLANIIVNLIFSLVVPGWLYLQSQKLEVAFGGK